MAEVHFLNVGSGDCCLLKSNQDRWTMFDICNGNKEADTLFDYLDELSRKFSDGNNKMCEKSINPIQFAKEKLNIKSIFRFILSHPDMDHMDGLNDLFSSIDILNFWDNGIRREKPDFTKDNRYKEKDWNYYMDIINGGVHGLTVISPLSGSYNQYFNQGDGNEDKGDFLYIYAPDSRLVKNANENGDINDGSYVICYRSSGGRILLCGDSHDKTWEHILSNYESDLLNCELIIAPHHGRDSDRDWSFLSRIKPKFGIIGCADSKDIAYNEWNNRNISKVTQNQAGNISIYPTSTGLDIYIENKAFAHSHGGNTNNTDYLGKYYLTTIEKDKNY